MTKEELKKEQESFEKYKKALKNVYADGSVSFAERNRLISLKNELGLSDNDCRNLESPYKLFEKRTEKKRAIKHDIDFGRER